MYTYRLHIWAKFECVCVCGGGGGIIPPLSKLCVCVCVCVCVCWGGGGHMFPCPHRWICTHVIEHKHTGRVSLGGWSLLPEYFYPFLARKSSGFAWILPDFLPENGYLKNSKGAAASPSPIGCTPMSLSTRRGSFIGWFGCWWINSSTVVLE